MTRHTRRSSAGRFTSASTTNAPEASAGAFATRTALPIDDESGGNWDGAEMHPHYGPQADELAQGGAQRLPHRRGAVVDADTGQHLGELSEDALSQVLRDHAGGGRATVKRNNHLDAAGGDDHLAYLLGGE
jgi:hypothetical protein